MSRWADFALGAMLGALAPSLAHPAWAGDAAPRCFKIADQRGRVEQVCESAGFVTIAPASAAGEAPSAEAGRAHAARHRGPFDGADPGTPPADPARPPDWSGLRVGLGPWGALSHAPDRGGFGVAARLGYDVAAQSPSPFVFGLLLEQSGRTSAGSPAAAGSRAETLGAVTSLDVRVGAVVAGRFMPYLVAGLATASRRVAPLDGGTVGAGLAYAVDGFWTLSIDYRHVALRTVEPGGRAAPARTAGTATGDAVHAMLLYRFL